MCSTYFASQKQPGATCDANVQQGMYLTAWSKKVGSDSVSKSAWLSFRERLKPYVPELLAELRAGTTAEPVPVMNDGSTFAIHGETRTFWVKLWHTAGTELTKIERTQIISCLPSTRGTNVIIGDSD